MPLANTMSQRTTLFLCPAEGCNLRFKTTSGRTKHICAKHPNFGINDNGPDDLDTNRGHQPSGTSNSLHTTGSQFDQADEHMIIDSDPLAPLTVSDDFLHPPMGYSHSSSPPLFDNMLPRPFSTFHSPVHPHDSDRGSESSDHDAADIESTLSHHSSSRATSTSPFLDSSPASPADTCAFTASDYHPILNGKFISSFNIKYIVLINYSSSLRRTWELFRWL